MKTTLTITSAIGLLVAVIGLSPGEAQTVSSSIGILPAGKSVTLTFDIRVRTPMPDSVTQVGTQGSISGSNFATLLTDDPDTGAPSDSTKTPVVSPPLPIQLASFTGTVVNHNQVRLDWMTLSEINNYGFEVQRSVEPNGNFQTIPGSFIPGHGTTNEPQYYTYTDTPAGAATLYYRLKQIDLDGTIHYVDPIRIDLLTLVSQKEVPTEFSLEQNHPNPFNPSTTIQYQLPQAAHVTLKIYNVLGQEVVTLVDGVEAPGYKTAVWNVPQSGIASGVYFYRIVMTSGQRSFVDMLKMLVVK